MNELTRTHHILLAVLAGHIGAGNGISAKALVREINGMAPELPVNERKLRLLVVDLRTRGHHVCGQPDTGYHMAADQGELDATCQFLFNRGMTGLRQVAAMKRVSLPDLAGQLRIPLEPA